MKWMLMEQKNNRVDFVVMILTGLNMQCDIYLGIMRINSGGKHKSFSSSTPSDQPSHSLNEQAFTQTHVSKLKTGLDNLHLFIQSLGFRQTTEIIPFISDQYSSTEIQRLTCEKVVKIAEARIEKMLKNRKIKKNWGSSDIQLLVWVLAKYLQLKMITTTDQLSAGDWKQISDLVPGSTSSSCQFRWLSLQKTKLSQNQWKMQETNILKNLVEQKLFKLRQIGTNSWKEVSEKLYLLHDSQSKVYRSAKQCRQYWSCFLNPTIKKGPWSEEEDLDLIRQIINHKGVKKWSVIVRHLKGRTENALKNRYSLLLEKEKEKRKKQMKTEKDEVELWKEYLSEKGIGWDIYESEIPMRQEEEANDKRGSATKSLSSRVEETQEKNSLSMISGSAFSVYKEGIPELHLEKKQSGNVGNSGQNMMLEILIPLHKKQNDNQ